jgi:excisionase family DNA binding protein
VLTAIREDKIMDPHKISRPEPLAVTVQEAIRVSGLSHSTIYELIKEGKLRTNKVAGRRLVFFESIKELLSAGVPAE